MTGSQFESVLQVSSRLALIFMGSLALFAALALGKPILAPIALSMVVGLMFGPLADVFERRGVPPALSAGIVVLVFIGIISVAVTLFAAPLSEWIARGPVIWEKLKTQLAGLKQPLEALSAVQEQLKGIVGGDAAMTVQVQDGGPVQDAALMAPGIVADALLFLAGLYFFLATRTQIRIAVLSLCLSRRTRWRMAHIFHDVEQKVSRFLISSALINLTLGLATTLAMWALGVPSPLLWGALAAVMNFIPYVGQAVMYVVLLAMGLGTQPDLIHIILPVAAYAVLNLAADQFAFPHLVGRALTLNPFVIFASTAFWLWVWGPMGGFISVPALLVVQSIIMHIFPTTASIPARTQRKLLEAKKAAEAANEAVAVAAIAVSEAEAATPKPARRRAPRKAAIAGSA
jgi:predicted PurR-regulated permease PerM